MNQLNHLQMEKWQEIPGLNGNYIASDMGNIASIDRSVTNSRGIVRRYIGGDLKPSMQRNGYQAVPISVNGKEKRMLVHRLIMAAFKGDSILQVNHLNGIKTDNRLENLEYCTCSENRRHSYKIGLSNHSGERHPIARFTNKQAESIRNRAKSGESTMLLAKEFNVVPSVISNIKYGRTYAQTTSI